MVQACWEGHRLLWYTVPATSSLPGTTTLPPPHTINGYCRVPNLSPWCGEMDGKRGKTLTNRSWESSPPAGLLSLQHLNIVQERKYTFPN